MDEEREKVEISEEAKKKINEEKIKVKLIEENKSEKKPKKKHKKQSEESKKDETIKKLEEENKELKDRLLRRLAEFENYKKRIKKEFQEYGDDVLGRFIFELLNVVDNFERALEHITDDEKDSSLHKGVKLIYKQLKDLLSNYGVEEIDTSNKSFNPYIHQALDKIETEDEIDEPQIVNVYQKGYKFKNKILRPALVKVMVKKEKKEENNEENKE